MIIFSSGCKGTNFFCNFFILDNLFWILGTKSPFLSLFNCSFSLNNLEYSKKVSIFAFALISKSMEATALNPTQMHLLKLFAFNNSEDYAREVQTVLTRHFQAQLDAEADRLWDEGILNQEKLDAIRQEDLHAK